MAAKKKLKKEREALGDKVSKVLSHVICLIYKAVFPNKYYVAFLLLKIFQRFKVSIANPFLLFTHLSKLGKAHGLFSKSATRVTLFKSPLNFTLLSVLCTDNRHSDAVVGQEAEKALPGFGTWGLPTLGVRV